MTTSEEAGVLQSFLDAHPSPLSRPAEDLRRLVATGALGEDLLPLPASGRTFERWSVLAAITAHDVALGRLAEGHADAVAILHEAARDRAGLLPEGAVLGVFAAGRADEIVADGPTAGPYRLSGRRRWCSGAACLTHCLVTARLESDPPGSPATLFLCPLEHPSIRIDTASWPAVGMARSETFDVEFDRVEVPAEFLVGGRGWYLERPGFVHGAAGVAACWYGGSKGVASALTTATSMLSDAHVLAAVGLVASELYVMEAALRACAARFDADPLDELGSASQLAELTRLAVEQAATHVLAEVGHATGAGPLGHDAAHAARVADLTVYLRQHHGRRDAEALGRRLLLDGNLP